MTVSPTARLMATGESASARLHGAVAASGAKGIVA